MLEERAFFDENRTDSAPVASSGYEANISETEDGFKSTSTTRGGAYSPRLLLSVAIGFTVELFALYEQSVGLAFLGLMAGFIAYNCFHVVLEWERGIVLRFGKLHKVAQPGLVVTIPFVDSFAAIVDMRMRSTAFRAERVLTSDLVPVNVDAVLFWGVFDAGKASAEVRNYERLVFWVAQTTLRDVMGGVDIAQLSTRRTQIDREVADILEQKTSEWGISVTSVEIRDIVVPEALQEALSAEARAKQEYQARVVRAEAEREAADMFVEAAEIYKADPVAMELRAMDFVYEGVKEKGSLVVVPSGLAQAFEVLNKGD